MSKGDKARARARAARCLRVAKTCPVESEKHSWLALAESWLQTVQLRQTADDDFQLTNEAKAEVLKWASQ